ncbi:endo-1,4-beta-xylanase [Brachybacterium sp. Z12]|uniref:endo-1,4-beta-xylanase n=1 Tax=Brachybacterium sp. Z12 TaxID=2759167 RepID=UPI00223BE252|nr:endo-1,4-beta-xylanase [Brachybacterium sp. Z12]
MTEAALSVEGCSSLTLWGVLDKYSWVPVTFPGEAAATVLWDDFSRKPAYYAVQDALAEASGRGASGAAALTDASEASRAGPMRGRCHGAAPVLLRAGQWIGSVE